MLGCGNPTSGEGPIRSVVDGEAKSAAQLPVWPENQLDGQLTSNSIARAVARMPSCGPSAELRSSGAGTLEVGMSVSDVLARCPAAVPIWEFEEGVAYPSLAVRFNGAVSVVSFDSAQPSAPSFRISTTDPLARTAEGLGPHSTLGALKAVLGPPSFQHAECAIFALFDSQPGVVWVLEFPGDWNCQQLGELTQSGGRRPPDSVRVVAVRLIPRTA